MAASRFRRRQQDIRLAGLPRAGIRSTAGLRISAWAGLPRTGIRPTAWLRISARTGLPRAGIWLTAWLGISVRSGLLRSLELFVAARPALHGTRVDAERVGEVGLPAAGRPAKLLRVKAPPEVPIITGALVGDVKPICPRPDRSDYVAVAQPILAHERVNYGGEPIAAVIADTAAEAEDLAEQVTVEIAGETPVVTLDEALAVMRKQSIPSAVFGAMLLI
jgi:hypothetical protein